jgi:hypothetical protein
MTWVMWNLILVCLDMVLVLVQDRCTVCAKRTIGSKIIFDTPDGTLFDMGHLESRLGLFGDGVCVHGLHQMYHRLRHRFGRTQWYSWLMRLN